MVRVSYDYDLMTVLARHLWHLRDELDVTSQSDKTFAPGDIGPRRETAEALEDFYGAWQKSFKEGWQAMTDLGNLLDRAGKAFYDQDASQAAGAAQQVTSQVRDEATRQNEIRKQTLDGKRREAMARNLEARYKTQQARLKKDQDALVEKRKKLDERTAAQQERQEELNKEQDALQARQRQLWQEEKDLQDGFGEEQDKIRDRDFGKDEDLGQLRGMRGQLDDLPDEASVPKGYTIEDENSSTTVSYQLDENGEIRVDKNGDPVETTTTVTNKNTGLSYSESYRPLTRDGDSVTTIHSSDGSVTKVYMDSSPEGSPDGWMRRYVTDETGRDTLQIWTKRPDGDWELTMDKETYLDSEAGKEDDQQFLDRPPAYLTVEKPLVDAGGHPSGSTAPGTATTVQAGVTRTDYTGSDGSVTKVVTNENTGTRYVADASNEIQEIWQRDENGGWYLRESITQHERSSAEPPLGSLGENWR